MKQFFTKLIERKKPTPQLEKKVTPPVTPVAPKPQVAAPIPKTLPTVNKQQIVKTQKFIRVYPAAVQILLSTELPEKTAELAQHYYPSSAIVLNNQTLRFGLMASNFVVEKYSKGSMIQLVLNVAQTNNILPHYLYTPMSHITGQLTIFDLALATNLIAQSRMYALPYTTHLLFDKFAPGHDYLELLTEMTLSIVLLKATIASAGVFSLATACTAIATMPHIELNHIKQIYDEASACIGQHGVIECTASAGYKLVHDTATTIGDLTNLIPWQSAE